MTREAPSELEKAYSGVSENFRGAVADPHALYKKMRETDPVYKGDFMAELGVPSIAGQDANRPCYTLFKYEDVMRVLRDSKTFTSGFIAEGLGAFFDGLILTGMDGDQHKKARALLAPVFTPSQINSWRANRIDRVIRDDYIAPLANSGNEADLMEVGLLFPIKVIYSLIGFPEDSDASIETFAAWALDILAGPQIDPEKAKIAREKAMKAVVALYDAILPIVERRRAEGADGPDLISQLINVEDDGRRLDDHEITTFVRSLLPAAAETTTRTFGTAIALLLNDNALLDKVKTDRGLITKIIDEAVRFEPTATFKVRQAAENVNLRGVDIPKDAMVSCVVTSANRDDEKFDNPDIFDPLRKPVPNFGFGFGAHMCIGLFVAKAEIDAALNAILDLMPNIRLDPDKPAPEITGLQLRGPRAVHVVW